MKSKNATLQFKCLTKTWLHMFFIIAVLLSVQACQNRDEGVDLKYKFENDKNYLSSTKLKILLNVNKVLLPHGKDTSQTKNVVLPFKSNLLSTDIRDMIANGIVKDLELELTKNKSETVSSKTDNSADIAIKSEVNSFALKANGQEFPLEQDFTSMVKIFLGGEQLRKLSSNGVWQDLPKIFGIDLSTSDENPYIDQLLAYLKSGFSYPNEKIKLGHTWDSDLHIFMPVDSISTDQSKGFISLDITNKRVLGKTEKNIANINLELSIKVSWDVIVPEQGYTKCDLTIKGKGYQFFDLEKGWDYGMFFKGNLDLKLDAETMDEANKNKIIPVIIDAIGTVEFASKLKV